MAGTVSSLGIGSGLQLRDILDQLRQVDEQKILMKQESIAELNVQLSEFSVVGSKLLSMKSSALNLSLSSTFLNREITSSSESVITATVSSGIEEQTVNVTVDRLASKSSWLSAGASASTAIVAVPTSVETTTGVVDPDIEIVMQTGEEMTIDFGGSQTFTVTAAGDLTMNQLVTEINDHLDNQDSGGPGTNQRFVWAETYDVAGETFLKISSDIAGGFGEDNRVAITEDLTQLDFADSTQSFQYEFNTGADLQVVTLNVAADTTMAELVDLINNDVDNPGITASIIDDGGISPYRLLLKSDDTGESSRINISGQLPDLAMAEQQGAAAASLNAQVTIDGIPYLREGNQGINDIISGVTLDFESTGTSTLRVSFDDQEVIDLVTSLVAAYNDVVQEIDGKVAYDTETGAFGILSRTTIRDIPFDLETLMSTPIRVSIGSKVDSWFDLGLTINRDGTITIDQSKLAEVVSENLSDVQSFFLGDATEGITGMADMLNDRLRVLTGGTGQVAAEKTEAQQRITDLESYIEKEKERLDRRYEVMTRQFTELDTYMNRMTSMSSYLQTQFESLSALTGTGSGKK
ncbi:MAG: flagellar filament capping protein FliD [Proteobacteria bacterium]|nr:flagellar filament capping protein FliD [Pseudomonadota bacterium]MBU1686219.1 flagellar filament capping protein FliD [Pseudomonadota bacterium]